MRNKVTHSSQTYTSYTDQLKQGESQIVLSSGSVKSNSGTQTSLAKGVGSSNTLGGSKSLIIGLRGDSNLPVEHIVINDIISNARGTTCA